MSQEFDFTVESVEPGFVQCSYNGQRFDIPIYLVHTKAGRQASSDEIFTGSMLLVKYHNNSPYYAELIDSYRRGSIFETVNNPLKQSFSFDSDSDYRDKVNPFIFQTENSDIISDIQTIGNLQRITSESKSTLSCIFSHYRKIQKENNLPIAFLISLIDQCCIFNKLDLLDMLKSTISIYSGQLISDRNELCNILEKIYNIICSTSEKTSKLQNLKKLYTIKEEDLESLFKNLLKISIDLKYHHKDFQHLQTQSLQSLIQSIQNNMIEASHLIYLLDYLEIQLKIIDSSSFSIQSIGRKSKLSLHLLLLYQQGYQVLYTTEEICLMETPSSQYEELLNLISDRSPSLSLSKSSSDEYEKQIQQSVSELNSLTNLLKSILTNPNLNSVRDPNSVQDLLSVQDLKSLAPFASELIDENLCRNCRRFIKTIDFPCSHSFCFHCSYSSYDESFCSCPICNFKAPRVSIDSKISQIIKPQ